MTKYISRLPEVMKKVDLSRSTIYLLMAKNEFPQSIKLGARAVGWVDSEIDGWVDLKIAESRQNQEVV